MVALSETVVRNLNPFENLGGRPDTSGKREVRLE